MNLESDKAALIQIVRHIDDEVTVEVRHNSGTAADDTHLVPILFLERRFRRIKTIFGSKVCVEPNFTVNITAPFLVVNAARRSAVRSNLSLIAVHKAARRETRRLIGRTELDAGIAADDFEIDLQIKIGIFLIGNEKRVYSDVARNAPTDDAAVFDGKLIFASLDRPAFKRFAVENRRVAVGISLKLFRSE